MLNQANLKELLHYDPETGTFTWLVNRRFGARRGDTAGAIKRRFGRQYREITIGRRAYQAHRLAFLWMLGAVPKSGVDHRDNDGLNNRWANLRPASLSQNAANAKLYCTNTSGFKGVCWNKKSGRWQAQIKKGGRTVYLGLFDDPEVAHRAYMDKARELFGEFARAA